MKIQLDQSIYQIIDQIDVAVAAVDCQYVYCWANQIYLERFEQSRQTLVGHCIADFFDPEQFLRLIKPGLDQCLSGKKIKHQSWYRFASTGNQFVEVTYNANRDIDNQICGVIITMRNFTPQKQVEQSLQQLNQELAIRVESQTAKLTKTNQDLQQKVKEYQSIKKALIDNEQITKTIIDSAPAVIYLKDLQSRLLIVNQEFERIFGLKRTEVIGRSDRQLFPSDIAADFAANDQIVLQRKKAYKTEEQVIQADGKLHTYLSIKFPILDQNQQVTSIGGVAVDITKRKQAQAALRLRLRQQAAIADLGGQALANIELNRLFQQATKLLAQNLEVEYSKVLELSDDGKTLRLKAGVGWQSGTVGQATVTTDQNSQAGYTLASNQAVVVEDLSTETRFRGPSLLIDHAVVSGMSTVIRGQSRPFGVLGIHTTKRRSFTVDDVNFLQAIANILATAIAFQQEKQALEISEQRFRATFEQAAVGIAHVAPDGKWLRVNQKLCDIVGYTSKELLTKTFQDITYPEDLESDLERVKQILAGQISTYSIEKRYIRRDGSLVWVNITVSLVEADQKPKYFISVIEDIDERKHLEATLARSHQRLKHLHAIDRAILATLDPEEIASIAMGYLEKLLPCRRITTATFDPKAKTAKVLLTLGRGQKTVPKGMEVDLEVFRPIVEQFQAGMPYVIADLSLFSSSSPRQQLALEGLEKFISLPFKVDNHYLGILKIWLDAPEELSSEQLEIATEVSNQLAIALQQSRLHQNLKNYANELETRVAKRTAQLQDINQQLQAFSYTISHDLKAPLRAIQGFATALQEDYQDCLDELGQEYTQRLIDSAQQMDRLIGDLLSYSRLSRAELQLQPVNLDAIVTRVIDQLQLEINQQQVQIMIEQPLGTMLGNQKVLQQAVENLLTNAIKFVDHDRVVAQIRIRSETRGDRLRLWVEDNGIGISADHYERIFKVFERLHGSEAYTGTGIGLALVKKGMERIGGQSGLESEIGGGSRFWIEALKV